MMRSAKQAPDEHSKRRRARGIVQGSALLMRLSEMVPLGHGFGAAANLIRGRSTDGLTLGALGKVHFPGNRLSEKLARPFPGNV